MNQLRVWRQRQPRCERRGRSLRGRLGGCVISLQLLQERPRGEQPTSEGPRRLLYGESGGSGRSIDGCMMEESVAADGLPAAVHGAPTDYEAARVDTEVFGVFQVGATRLFEREECAEIGHARFVRVVGTGVCDACRL